MRVSQGKRERARHQGRVRARKREHPEPCKHADDGGGRAHTPALLHKPLCNVHPWILPPSSLLEPTNSDSCLLPNDQKPSTSAGEWSITDDGGVRGHAQALGHNALRSVHPGILPLSYLSSLFGHTKTCLARSCSKMTNSNLQNDKFTLAQ